MAFQGKTGAAAPANRRWSPLGRDAVNQKLVFGILLTAVSCGICVFGAVSFYAAVNPCSYNVVNGIMDTFLGTGTLCSFTAVTAAMCAGILIPFLRRTERTERREEALCSVL